MDTIATRVVPMTNAGKVRRGLKLQTRRLVTARTSLVDGTGEGIRKLWPQLHLESAWVDPGPSPAGNPGPYLKADVVLPGDTTHRIYPRIFTGDRIYIREDWCVAKRHDKRRASDVPHDAIIITKSDNALALAAAKADRIRPPSGGGGYLVAGGELAPKSAETIQRFLKENVDRAKFHSIQIAPDEPDGKWRPAMHMPRWASRTWLEVTELRAERVQDITEDDAADEGCDPFDFTNWSREQRLTDGSLMADAPTRASFAIAWDEINGDRALFKSNPWVWVYTFREINRPQ